METRVLSFSIIAFALLLVQQLLDYRPIQLSRALIREACAATSPEGVLACGRKIPMSSVDQFALELIPGISESASGRILAMKSEILQAAGKLPEEERYKALLIVKGIGAKKAQEYNRYIGFF